MSQCLEECTCEMTDPEVEEPQHCGTQRVVYEVANIPGCAKQFLLIPNVKCNNCGWLQDVQFETK